MRWKPILYNIAFAINCLLAFLLVFESRLEIPAWLQVFGRMHPLFLHIPIGFMLLYALMELFSMRKSDEGFTGFKDGLLLCTAVTVAVTALMGLFLSREDGYDPDAIAFHKWAGTVLSFMLLAWYQWRNAFRQKLILNKVIALVGIGALTVAGHLGGEITHGDNFVLQPVTGGKSMGPEVAIDDAIIFRDMVQPIINEKCITCHNSTRAKGELIMESTQLLLKGGKNGKLWDTTENDLGLLLHRIYLPLEQEDHMPPKRKPQLSEAEKLIFKSWIRLGSSFTMKVADLKQTDTLNAIAATMFTNGNNETYTFEKADDKVVRNLNNFYRVIQPIAEGSPALAVSFFGKAKFRPESIIELHPVREQVVEMDLSSMPVDDAHLKEIAEFKNLRKLNLAFTKVNGAGLQTLRNLAHLKEISLSGTPLGRPAIDSLKKFPALKKVFVWNVPSLDTMTIAKLSGDTGRVKFETGYRNDTLVLKLTAPIIRNEQFVITEPVDLLLKHNINGAQIRYTLDGTIPDSIRSPLFNNDVRISKSTTVKCKVFRKGWESSDVETIRFFFSTAKAKTVSLAVSPNELFQAGGGSSLFDYALGGLTTTSGAWLGFRYPQVFEAVMDFDKETTAKSITLSALRYTDNDVFPPESISLWYSTDNINWKKVNDLHPKQPEKNNNNEDLTFVFNMPDVSFRYVKIKAVPSRRMPAWRSKKPNPAWLFVDEVIVD